MHLTLQKCDDEVQMRMEEETKKKLEVYVKDCLNAGIDCALLAISKDHPGLAISQRFFFFSR